MGVDFKERLLILLPRKIVSASIAGSLYAILFGLVAPHFFSYNINSTGGYLWSFIVSTPFYMMYSFPVVLLYGGITSTVSDLLSDFIAKRTRIQMEIVVSALFHLLFGLLFLWISLSASALFFITDRLLAKRGIYGWTKAVMSLSIPIIVWLAFMAMIWIRG